MQMLTKNEFVKELLNKYEISHGLSDDIIDGMISRGFIPSVTNEVGDETYNIDYYIENEDVFDKRLTEYKNTRGYYTDAELQKALADRDSDFASVPINAFDDLVRRNLVKEDSYYVVREHEKFLFSPTLIYDIEQIKSALEELDAQLEAEEVEELGLLENELDMEEPEPTTEETPVKSDDEDEFIEEFWDDDDAEERKQKQKKKKAQEQKRKDAQRKKTEENAYAERIAAENKRIQEAVKVAADTKAAETAESDYKKTQNVSEHEKENIDKEKSIPVKETVVKENEKFDTKPSESAHTYETSDAAYQSTNTASETQKRKEEDAARARQYEENRRKEETKKEDEKPKPRNEDGSFTFTGTSVGKTDSSENSHVNEYSYGEQTETKSSESRTDGYSSLEKNENHHSSETKPTEYHKPLNDNPFPSKETSYNVNSEKSAVKENNKTVDNPSTDYSSYDAYREEERIRKDKTSYSERQKEESPEKKSQEHILRNEDGTFSFSGTSIGHSEQEKSTSSETTSASTYEKKEERSPEKTKYKINVPLADGSYMTFESLSDNKQESKTQRDVSSDSKYSKSVDPYDNYNTRVQAAYVASGTVMSQAGVDEIVSSVAQKTGEDGFKVSVVKVSENGATEEKTIYSSKDANTFLGDISESYKKGNHAEFLPESTPEQIAKDQRVLFAVGINNGGEIKGDTYIPPAVPTIHPRVFDELAEKGIKNVEIDGIKVDAHSLAEASKSSYSIVENSEKYQNATVSQELINKATGKNSDIVQFSDNTFSVDDIKKAEKTIAKSAEAKNEIKRTFSLDNLKDKPEFVSGYLREKYTSNQNDSENIGSDTTVRTMNGFGSKRTLGDAKSIATINSLLGYSSETSLSDSGKNYGTATKVLDGSAGKFGSTNKSLGTASDFSKPEAVTLDFSNPKEIENYAAQIEDKNPTLAKELRTVSKDINGDIATVLASQTTGEKIKVDGARLINNPDIYVAGKTEYAEIIASAIEKQHPENAAKIRELSKDLNGDAADIYRGKNETTGEYMLRNPEKFIKGRAADSEAVANAIEGRYPETAKKIRDLSQKLNGDESSSKFFKQFGVDGAEGASNYSVELAQELLKNTHVLKGHAKEVEDIASSIEMENSGVAKQLRQASKAQNGAAADIYERATFATRQFNKTMFYASSAEFGTMKYAYSSSDFANNQAQGVFSSGKVSGFKKDSFFKPLSADNIRTKSEMMTFTEKDRFGRKHLGVAVKNADGTMNITWNANSKKGAVTLMGYAPDVKSFDSSQLQSSLASKSKLAKAGIRNRKLNDVRLNTSKNAQFFLSQEWVKSMRKKQSVVKGNVKDVDDLTKQMVTSAAQIYKLYEAGQLTTDMELMHNKHGFAGDGTVVKGLRITEQLKKDRQDALGKVASNIMWHVMPMQELNSTYLGSGYKYLFGRGSFLWTVSNIGAGLNAKDELRKLNRDLLKESGPSEFALLNRGNLFNLNSEKGRTAFNRKTASMSEAALTQGVAKFNLHSAKDRRRLTKELQKLSKAELKIDITRLSDKSLKEAFIKGRLDTRTLSEADKAMFAAVLQMRGLSNGTLSTFTARQYLNRLGIGSLDSNLSDAHKKLLAKAGFAGRSLDSLNQTEVAQIFNYFKENKISAPADLISLLERAEHLNFANLDTNQGMQILLSEINLAGQNLKINGVLRPTINISDLSTKQIKLLIKQLPKNDAMSKLLQETLKLREFLEKKSKIAKAIGNLKNIGGFMARKAMFKLRGQALGDGMYAFYSAYRTMKTSIQIFQTLRALRKTNQAAFRQFLMKGKPGGLRNRLVKSKHFKRKFARQDAKQAKILKKAQNKSRKELLKKSKRSNRIKKVKGKLSRRTPRGLRRLGNRFKKIGSRAGKVVGAIFKPFKVVTGFINKVKQKILEKLIIPIIKYGAIAIGVIVLLQIGLGLADAALEGVYSIVNYTADTRENIQGESVDMSVEDSLTYNSVEIGINLDSAFKYYIEKYYEEKTVIDAVKDSIDDVEKEQFFDPADGKYANIKRLGTTLNGIQTGVYYSYYNGDGKEIGFKSNSKDIAAMANAWIGEDYHAKGLYKSYVEKLWNYSHMVAYAPRQYSEAFDGIINKDDVHKRQNYRGTYMYSCPSNLESSECYENAYDYKCNNGGANVYEGDTHNVRMDIQNGNDKTTGKTNYTYTNNTLTNKTNYTVKNGIVQYNSLGCSQHIMTYHKGSASKEITNKILANGIPTYKDGKWQYITALGNQNKNVISLPNGQTTTIRFYSNGDNSAVPAPTGCSNWKYINTAYKKTDGTVVACRAYYCAGCHNDCSEKNHVAQSMPTQKIAYHTGLGRTTISGKTYYKLGTINSECKEKETKYHSNSNMSANGKTYNHVIGTSHSSCNNYGSFVVSTSHTTSSKEYCSTSYCQKVTSSQICTWKLSTYKGLDGRTYASIYNPLTQGKWITVMGNKIYAYKASGLQLTVYASAPSGWYIYRKGYVNFNDRDFSCSSATVNGVRYVWNIYPNNYGKTYGTVNLTCYQTPCKGHNVTNTTTTNTTYYYCKGHERCKGYLASAPHDISVNYCKGYCPGHTLEHYCTGHVDLNIAVVTLFLGDKNDLAYLGIPKEVTTEKKEVSSIVDSLTGEESNHELDVQSPKDGTEYLYDNAFSAPAFERFDYEKYPLPGMSVMDDFAIDLKGKAVNDPGNFGNPLDTLRWNSYFVENYVEKSHSGTKSLNSVISTLFSTYSKHGYWFDLNDGGTPTPSFLNSYDIFSIKGDYSKFEKHHYFDGWFTYDIDGKIEWAGPDGHKTPKDTGAYARAVESTKEDWYEAYKISFPGAYNSRPDNKEIDRILKNINQYCVGYTAQKLPVAKQLLEKVGDTYSGSGIEFAVTWYQNFYKSFKGSENSSVSTAFNEAKRFTTSYTYQAKAFRRALGVKSMKKNNQGPNVIKNLSAGDLIGAGDEVYVVLYTDAKADGVGIDKGHVIVATVNGSDSSSGNDQIHLFSFTTEYISKKSELFWIYKCN